MLYYSFLEVIEMSMGSRVQNARKNKGFTQEYVAASLGVSRQAVFKWEKDQTHPDTENLIALAQLLDVSVDFLATGAPDKHKAAAAKLGFSFRLASLIPLLIILICWIIGVCSGEYTDMVQIPVAPGMRMGIPFLMYGHSPSAIALMIVSIICAVLFVLFLILGYLADKHGE